MMMIGTRALLLQKRIMIFMPISGNRQKSQREFLRQKVDYNLFSRSLAFLRLSRLSDWPLFTNYHLQSVKGCRFNAINFLQCSN